MDKIVNIIAKTLLIIIFAVGIIYTLLILVNPSDANVGKLMDTLIPFSKAILIFTIASAILFSLFNLVTDKNKAIKSGIVIVFMGILVLVSYGMSSGEVTGSVIQRFFDNGDITKSIIKLVDMGLYLSYIIAGLTILTFLYSGIASLFNR